MGLSQQVATQEPVRKTLPPKPKKTHSQELTQREHKVLPKKSDSNEMESFDQIFSDNYGLEEFPFLNTPPMEYVSPASAEDASYFDSEEADTEPMCAEEEVWGNLGCVSPGEAEGMEDVEEAKVDLNAVLDFNLERREEVIYEFTLPVEADENNSFSLNLNPDLNLLGTHNQDIIRDTMMMSGINIGLIDVNNLTSLPEPIPSTSFFIQGSDTAPEDDYMETVNPTEVEGILPTMEFEAVQTDCTTTYIPSTIPDEEEEEVDPNDPDWSLADLLNVAVNPSSRRQRIMTPKAKLLHQTKPNLHAVKGEMKRRRPGRPERQEPFTITVVPSRKATSSISEEDLQSLKYRRMRDLNNKASKDCRARRKNKNQLAEEELEQLTEKNLLLRQKLAKMEKEAAYYRRMNNQ